MSYLRMLLLYCTSCIFHQSVVSRAFSVHAHAMHVFNVQASSSPLGYPCTKFHFCHTPIAELARREKLCTQSVTHSPSFNDMPGTEARSLSLRKIQLWPKCSQISVFGRIRKMVHTTACNVLYFNQI